MGTARHSEVLAAPAQLSCFRGPVRFDADVISVCGYADGHALPASVSACDALLRQLASALTIADYAPPLSLAAFGHIPPIAIGDGFVTPNGELSPVGRRCVPRVGGRTVAGDRSA